MLALGGSKERRKSSRNVGWPKCSNGRSSCQVGASAVLLGGWDCGVFHWEECSLVGSIISGMGMGWQCGLGCRDL